jgi:hypothetical protein
MSNGRDPLCDRRVETSPGRQHASQLTREFACRWEASRIICRNLELPQTLQHSSQHV